MRGSAPRPPRHEPGASGGTRRNTGGSPPRRSAPTPASDAWTTRSVIVAIPSRRSLPPAFGIIRSRTGNGRKLRSFNEVRSLVEELLDTDPRPRWTRAVRPSTPAVLAPLLPRTRSHATNRNAGIGDEVEQVIEPAMRIITGPTVQLGLDLQYPTLSPQQGHLPVRRCSPATSSWHSSIRLLTCWPPSPCVRLSRPPRRVVTPATTTRPPPHPRPISRQRTCPPAGLAARQAGRPVDGSHVHHAIDRPGRCPALPRQHRHGYAADLHRGLPTAELNGFGVDQPHTACGSCTAHRPISTRFEPASRLRGFSTGSLALHLLVSLAGPAPSGSAGTSRLCQGRLPPSPASPRIRLPPASSGRCDGPAGRVSHLSSINTRLVAHSSAAKKPTPPRVSRSPAAAHAPHVSSCLISARRRSWCPAASRRRSRPACTSRARCRRSHRPASRSAHSLMHRQLRVLLTRFVYQPHRPLPQLRRVLPRRWHVLILSGNQSLHQTRGGSKPLATASPSKPSPDYQPHAKIPRCSPGRLSTLPGHHHFRIRGQPEFTEYRPERLPRVDRVEELLPHLDGQACLRSGSSPGSLGVAVRSPAEGAPTAAVPARRRAVPCLTHDRNASGRSSLQHEQLRTAPPAGFISLSGYASCDVWPAGRAPTILRTELSRWRKLHC